eukprot:13402788-Ditylum_brightwellii.AAC.1
MPKMLFGKHWTNQCTSEDKKTPKKNKSSKTPWYLVPPVAGTTHLRHCDAQHNWCTDCTPPSWRCHKLGDEHKKFMYCHKHKNTTTALLAAMETDTVAGITVTEE